MYIQEIAVFEWDDKKNRKNIRKHGVSFELASQIFDDITISWEDTRKDYGEKRFISIGLAENILVLAVAHTDREGNTRIISARKASKKERSMYNDKIQQRAIPKSSKEQKRERH